MGGGELVQGVQTSVVRWIPQLKWRGAPLNGPNQEGSARSVWELKEILVSTRRGSGMASEAKETKNGVVSVCLCICEERKREKRPDAEQGRNQKTEPPFQMHPRPIGKKEIGKKKKQTRASTWLSQDIQCSPFPRTDPADHRMLHWSRLRCLDRSGRKDLGYSGPASRSRPPGWRRS